MTSCFLAEFSELPCDGRLVRCHLIPQQVIKRECGTGAKTHSERSRVWEIVWDSRTWVWGCGGAVGNAGHHGMLDASRTLRVPREALPVGLEELAAELGLSWWLDREYGEREMAA